MKKHYRVFLHKVIKWYKMCFSQNRRCPGLDFLKQYFKLQAIKACKAKWHSGTRLRKAVTNETLNKILKTFCDHRDYNRSYRKMQAYQRPFVTMEVHIAQVSEP